VIEADDAFECNGEWCVAGECNAHKILENARAEILRLRAMLDGKVSRVTEGA
jgi:hypothetical protein